MKKSILSLLTLASLTTLGGTANAALVTYFEPTDASNSNATFSSINTSYTTNYGVAFKTGSDSAGYALDWVTLGLNSSSFAGESRTVNLALRNATSDTPYVGVAGTTEYAVDTLSFTLPVTGATSFDLELTASEIPNIAGYTMAADTAYTLILYSPSGNFGVQRHTGYSNGTTNNFYTVSNGFVALDTFRNNTANYSNNASSFPTLDFSFGADTTPVPGPSTYALFGLGLAGLTLLNRRRKKA